MRKNIKFVYIVALTLYLSLSVVSFYKLVNYTYTVFREKQRFGLNDLSLDCSPYYQVFSAHNIMGLRLYLTNETMAKEGFVYVNIGNYETGETLLKSKIAARDIKEEYNNYIDIVSKKVFSNETNRFWFNIYVDEELAGKIKTKYFGHEKRNDILMHVGKHLYKCHELTMSYELLVRRIPFTFIIWIYSSCLIVLAAMMHKTSVDANKNVTKISIEKARSHKLLLVILIVLGLFGTGIIEKDFFIDEPLRYDLDDDRFEEGLILQEKSVTNFRLNCTNDYLNSIQIKLDSYPMDLAEYTIVLNDKDDQYIADIYSSDLDFDGTRLIWDLSDMAISNYGYTIDIFFPIKGDKPAPVIKGVRCVFGKEHISIKRIIIGFVIFVVAVILAIVLDSRNDIAAKITGSKKGEG